MALRRSIVNADIENEILTALITNTQFIRKLRGMYNEDYFSEYGKIITKWVFNYWDTYQEAPGKTISSIYSIEKETLKPAIADSIAAYLETLSSEYTGDDINVGYVLEKTQTYFRRKSYEKLFTQGRDLITLGRIDDAIKLHQNFRVELNKTAKWENVFSGGEVAEHFNELEEQSNELFSFRGALGELFGPLERGWLVGIMGPMKRGKSFWLQEALFQAATAKRRVAYINLEMLSLGVRDRLYTRLLGVGRKTPSQVKFPVFDCAHNQRDTCPVSRFRQNDIPLISGEDYHLPRWGTPGLGDYRVCTYCRNNTKLRHNFIPDVWYEWHCPKRDHTRQEVARIANAFIRHYGDRIRQITYPAYSVSIDQIIQDLNELEWVEDFYPDIVLLDYADIVAPQHAATNEYEHTDFLWKRMKGCAVEKRQLWITGSQTNRGGLEKDLVSQKDTSGNIRKLAHVDIMGAINQTDEEKEDLITRMTCLVHRHIESSQLRQVLILSQLALGMPYLDSEHCEP